MKRSSVIGLLVLILVVSLSVVACGTSSGTTTTAAATGSTATTASGSTASSAAVAEGGVVKLGCTLPLSVSVGPAIKSMYDLAVQAVNDAGGLVVQGKSYKLEFICYDDQNSTEGGKAAGERLVNQDKVDYLVGCMAGGGVPATQSVSEPAKKLLITSAINDDLLGPANSYTYRGHCYTSTYVKWDFCLQKYPNVKKVVHIGADSALGKMEGGSLDTLAKVYGLEVLKHFYVADGTTDFSSVAASAIALKPDIIDVDGFSGQTLLPGPLYKALYQAGWTGPKIMSQLNEDDIIAAGGPEPLEGVLFVYQDMTAVPDPPAISVELRKAWEASGKKWNEEMGPFASGWIDPFYMFLAAVQKADSLDTEKISAALTAGLEYDGAVGHYIMVKRPDLGTTKYVDSLGPTSIGIVRSGKMELLGTVTAEQGLATLEKMLGHPGEWK